MKEPGHELDYLAFAKDELWVPVMTQETGRQTEGTAASVARAFDGFRASSGRVWTMRLDAVTGRPALMEGEGIPWIPGTASGLTSGHLGLPEGIPGNKIPLDIVAEKARTFLRENPGLFGVDPDDLTLNRGASGPVLDYLYFVHFDWTYRGIPVDGAGLVFRLNHGNLIQVGQDFVSDSILSLDPTPALSAETAWEIVRGFAGVAGGVEVVEPGRLLVLPVSTEEVRSGEAVVPGRGIWYRLAYDLAFRVPGATATWQARVDAHTGEILSFLDSNMYGHIQGGVHLTDGYPADTSMPFPYANYSGTTLFADVAGNFTGTTGTSTLVGDLVRITDSCGTISQAADGTGLVDFGTNTGTNCTTPGHGGAGNTRAARTQYWHVTSIKIKALTYMPTNNWLSGQLLDRTNLTTATYCPGNAWWDGTALNFCVGDNTYGNTGELPGVSLHEWGHGMDANDGRAPADEGTGETYGDFSGVLQTHQSCVGAGFFGTNCDGYGDACKACKGIRDINWSAHADNVPHTPFMLDDTDPNSYTCRWWAWPQTYNGPCRYEGHCESYISSETCWDLAVRDLPAMGIDATTAWQIMDRLWYASRTTAQSAYSCSTDSSGNVLSSNGGNAGSHYNIFRAVDDCDGNLTNGTPHAAAIFAALARHNIAVGAAGDATNQNQTNCCPTLSTPNLGGSAASCQNNLSWNDITNATRYKVYRNETSCTAGFTLIGTVNDPTLTFADTSVSAGTTYYYRIQALSSSDACTSAMSNCVTLTAAACGGSCTAPGAPNLTAATGDCSGVNLTWTAGTGTTSSYNVYRYTGACGGAYAKIAGPVTGTTYSDTTAVAGTSYAYVVRGACDAGGTTESPNSNCRTATPLTTPAMPAAPTVTDDCTGLIVSWSAITGASSYNVWRRNNGCGSNSWSAVQSGVTGTTWTDTTVAVGSTYGYYIVAVNACGSAGDKAYCGSATHDAAGAPSAPAGLAATGACAAVNLSWTASAGAASYNVLRTTNSNCTTGLAQIGTSATTSYSDTTAVVGTTYYYVVQAVSSCGTSGNSSCANAARLQTPAAPTGLIATGTCTAVNLSWTASSGATSYEVWRTTNANCTTGVASIGTSATTTYSDTTAVAGTTYYYTVKALNACGTSGISNCANAARLATPAAPAGLSAAGSCTGVDLSWTASPGATSYEVWRGTNANCTTGAANIGTSATTTYSDTTAVAGTTYYYTVKAVNTCGTSGISNCANAARLATPAAPGGPTYTNVSCNTLTVNWVAVSGATAYDLYRRTGACGAGSVIGSNLAGTSYADSGLSASTQYSYYLAAKNTCGSSADGTCTSATTTGVPTAPAGLTATGTCTAVDLSWTASPGATSYDVWRTTNANCTTGAASIGTSATTTYSDTTAVAGTTYYYTVKAVNACGTSGISNCANAARLATPAAPTGLAATGTCTAVNLSWTASSGATSYEVWRTTNANCTTGAASIGTSATTTYSDTTAVAGTTYYYTVKAVNACGTSGISNCANAVRLVIPAAPVGLSAAGSCTGVDLSWTASSGATSYEVWRTTNSNCTTGAASIGTSATTTYSDTTAVAGTTYYYTVKAVNACGTSGISNCANAARLATPAAPGGPTYTNLSCSSLTVNWTAVSGATGYDLYRRTGACGAGATIATNLTGTSYGDTGLSASTQYSYYLVAKNTCGNSADGTCSSATTTGVPTAPAAPTVTDDCTGLALSWGGASGATSYNVYRRNNGCGTNSWSQVQTGLTGTSWTDTTAVLSITYGYYIEAVNACGTATSGNGACTAGTHSLQTPVAPGSVTATGTCADVTVSWGSVSGATSYNVLRGTVCGTAVTTFTGVTSPYHDTSAVAGTAYQYWVVAVNSCGTSADSSCASAARLVTPTPTITGAGANSCPATTVALSTESGQNSYQWYRGGSPIGGANAYQYTVTQTGDYTVSYSNAGGCSGTSAAKTVTIIPCVPNIVYSANGSWTQVYGNGDAVVDPGETWDITVTLQNSGTGDATNVSASLTATGATFCTGTASYGAMVAGTTATGTFRFVVEGTFTCGNSLSFNVVGKTSAEGGYPDEGGAFTRQVGAPSGPPVVTPHAGTTGAIPDNTGVPFTGTAITSEASPTQVQVAVTITHQRISDITPAQGGYVRLRLPDGTTLVDLSAGILSGVEQVVDITGQYQGPGTYTLEVLDNKAVKTGTVDNWRIDVTSAPPPACNAWSGQSCLSGPVPKPVPDGKWVSGTPLAASKANADGTTIDLTWGVPCPSTNYNVLYGNGSQVSSVTTSGSQCPIGATGSYTWNTVPTIPGGETFLWWVIVGTDGSSTEGSWGKDSAGNERNGASASNRCGFTLKNTTGTCP